MSKLEHKCRRVIIIGASIAGSLLARLLADRFDEVVLIDRDTFPDNAFPRVNVPQEHHVHLLLQRGREIMEAFYPGFLSDIEKAGAEVVDLSHGVKWYFGGCWKNRWPTGVSAHYCSRTLIEHSLRKHAEGLGQVVIKDNTTVLGLVHDSDRKRVTGVYITGSSGSREEIRADLVIDAGGRGSKASSWLKQLGYGKAKEEQVISRLGYVSRIYKRNPAYGRLWKVLLVTPKLPNDRRMAVVSPIEGNRYMVTTGGWFGAFPEPTEEGFLSYLKALPVPDVYEAVRKLEPIGEINKFQMPGGLRRRYDLMEVWPEGFLVIGDAICSINPIYSQGMSVSAMQIEALQRHIDAYLTGKAQPQVLLSVLIEATERSWQQAKAGDEQLPEMGVNPGFFGKIKGAYFDLVTTASAQDRSISVALLKVNNLVISDKILLSPGVVWKVLVATILRNLQIKVR